MKFSQPCVKFDDLFKLGKKALGTKFIETGDERVDIECSVELF